MEKTINIVRYNHYIREDDETVKCLYIDFKNKRLLLALCDTYWHNKGKRIWISLRRKEVIIHRLAIRFGRKIK